MHSISFVSIRNFRSCLSTDLQLHAFTPIVGYNNAGKSNILTAIEWLLSSTALGPADFNATTAPLSVEGRIEGIDEGLLDAMPPNQTKAVRPFLDGQSLRIKRTMPILGAASTAKIEVRDPAVTEESGTGAWKSNPTGLDSALKALFPTPIRIHAMESAGDDVGKSTKSNTIGKLIAAITETVKTAHADEFIEALRTIRNRLAADGCERAVELQTLDAETTAQLADLFPGLSLKKGAPVSTQARNPLLAAAAAAIADAPAQARMIFELGRTAEVFFSDRVLIAEGKTEARLLPVAYESLRGRSLKGDRLGLVAVDSSTGIVPAMRVLREMQIEALAVADLDFAFKVAPRQGVLPAADPDLMAAAPILAHLAPTAGFALGSDGYPSKGGGLKPADAWATFAADPGGALIAANLHTKLLAQGIWLWKVGAIEDALGSTGKGEQAIQALELALPAKAPTDIRSDLPEITALLDWFSPPSP